jgi:hypothetical protein
MRISGNPVLFHTGAIVDDIERAMDDMTAAFGTEWCAPSKGGRTEVWTPGGMVEFENRLVFSLDPAHRVELIEQVDVSELPPAPDGRPLHHLGYWVSDLDSARAEMEAMGYPVYFARLSDDRSTTLVSYHVNPTGGLFIELLDRTIQPSIEAWINGSELRLSSTS